MKVMKRPRNKPKYYVSTMVDELLLKNLRNGYYKSVELFLFFQGKKIGKWELKEPEDKRYFWVGSIFSCGFYSLFQFSKVENLSKASKWFFAQRETFKKWYVNVKI